MKKLRRRAYAKTIGLKYCHTSDGNPMCKNRGAGFGLIMSRKLSDSDFLTLIKDLQKRYSTKLGDTNE